MQCRRLIWIIALIAASSCRSAAQTEPQRRFTAELSLGSSVTEISVYDEEDMNIVGFAGSLRLLWEPERLLRIGLESGLIHLAHAKEDQIETDFGSTKRANSLNAYPALLHFNMKLWKLELMLGLGAAVVTSKIKAFDDISVSNVITSARMYGLGCSVPISDKMSMGGEFKFYSFSTPALTVGTAKLKFKYAVFEW